MRFKRVSLVLVCLVVIAIGVAAPYGSRVGLWVLAAAVPVAVVVLWAGKVVVEVSAVSVASRLTRKKVGARSLVVTNTTPIATATTAR